MTFTTSDEQPPRKSSFRPGFVLTTLLIGMSAGRAAHAQGDSNPATDMDLRTIVPRSVRTYDGSFNNRRNPNWGSTGVQLARQVPANYSDGLSALARARGTGPRQISNLIFTQARQIPNDRGLTDMVWQWGQFLDHDIDLTESHLPAEAQPIAVPRGDPWFDPNGTGSQVISFFRSVYDPSTGIETPREQLNVITAWIDGSNVYGSSEETANSLRLFRDGLLKFTEHPTGDLLPLASDGFFVAGDVRANEQVCLTAMHTLFMREHNRLCRQLARNSRRRMTDEELYQAARSYVIALLQAITYNEFLPAILGTEAMDPYPGYQSRVNPNIRNSFSTAAFRFGHSMLNSELLMMDRRGRTQLLNLSDAFFDPTHILENGIEPFLLGLCNQPAQEIDAQVVGDVRNFLFGDPGAGGFDLVSLNIQRGRDHGLPGFTAIRAGYGLPPIDDFSDITSNPVVRMQLAAVYENVDEVDPWVGMLCEDHLPGTSVGMTAFVVIKDQFDRLRNGDRFWYERVYSGPTLARIRSTSLSSIIRRNTKIRRVPVNAFQTNLNN